VSWTVTSGHRGNGDITEDIMGADDRKNGTVKYFNTDKDYGFIAPSDGSADVFVHISAIQKAGLSSLTEGDKVSYVLTTDSRNGKTSAEQIQWGRS
jgi:CspA family cold shock protein